MYNKNVKIFSFGNKIGEMETIRIEDLFDDGLAYGCDVYVNAIHEEMETSFLIVPDINLYIDVITAKNNEEKLKVIECHTDRSDYKFYEITAYDEDEDGINEYSEKRYIASFFDGAKRKFGSASFRTIKDAVRYIKIGEDTEKMRWKDGEGRKYSIDDLYNLETVSILFHMTLDKYSIFDRSENCIFSREIDE